MNSTPPFLGRLFALFVFLATVLALLLSVRYTTEIARNQGLAVFRTVLFERGDSRAAHRTLTSLEATHRLSDELPIPPFSPYDRDDWTRTVPRLRLKLVALSQVELGKRESPEMSRLSLSLSEEDKSRFSSLQRAIGEVDERIAFLSESLLAFKRKEELSWTKIRLLTEDVRNLLNLPAKQLSREEIVIYPEGLLKGLPLLSEIPRTTLTPTDLRIQLETLEIPLPKVTPVEFEATLETLRTSFETTIAELTETESLLAEGKGDLLRSKAQQARLSKEAKNFIHGELEHDLRVLNP